MSEARPSTPKKKSHQVEGIQLLRALAVSLVAWGHAGQFWTSPLWPVDFGVFGVDIFFVISGFIMALTTVRLGTQPGLAVSRSFLARRFVRIYPVYWVISFFVVVRLWLSHQGIAFDYVWGLLLVPSPHRLLLGVAWTLVFEMLFYLLMSFVLALTLRRALPLAVLLLTLLVGAGMTFDIRQPVWIVVCNPILIEFLFGVLVAILYLRWGTRRRLGVGLLLAGSALAVVMATHRFAGVANSNEMVLRNDGVLLRVATRGLSAALLVAGTVFRSPAVTSRLGKIGLTVGAISYSTYLISGFALEFGFRGLVRLFGSATGGMQARLYQAGILLFVLAAGWAAYHVIEQPLTRCMTALLRRRESRGVDVSRVTREI